jgi:glutathione S-transferase
MAGDLLDVSAFGVKEVRLQGFGTNGVLVDASPFVCKVHAFLRLARIPYVTRQCEPSATERWPWVQIVHADGRVRAIYDSQVIIRELSTLFRVDVDAHLTADERLRAEALRLLFEGVAYKCYVRFAWVDNIDFILSEYPLPLPLWLRKIVVARVMRNQQIAMLDADGNGDLTKAENEERYSELLRYAAMQLGDKPFLFGERMTTTDCALFTYLQDPAALPIMPERVKAAALAHPALLAYSRRVREALFPDHAALIAELRSTGDKLRASMSNKINCGAAVALASLCAVVGFVAYRLRG